MAEKEKRKLSVEPWVFIPPLVGVIALVAWVVANPSGAGEVLGLLAWKIICADFGWFFELFYGVIVVICIILCVHPIGKKRFGQEKPEFSTFSWLGMMFTAVAGFGVLTWTSIEWFYYYQAPIEGVEPFSMEALYMAPAFPLHHWGIIAFTAATLMGVVTAYQIFCKKSKDVRPSTACISILGEKKQRGVLGKTIDALFAISLLTGVVTCIGVNVPTLFAIIGRVFGTQISFGAESFVIILWSIVMALLLYTGLSKGIRVFSDVRVYLGFGILVFLLIVGPTTYLLNAMVDNIGIYIHNVLRLTFDTDTFAGSGTPQSWTVFYWCWYLALAIQTGIFFAKISRGRTVRQLVVFSLLAQTIGSWLFFGVFMNYSIYTYQNHTIDIAGIIATVGQGEAIVALWDYIPFVKFLYPILMVYGFMSMQTLLNGNIYSMAMVTSKSIQGSEEPPRWNRIFWSLGVGAIAISLLLIGGISPAQCITIIGSVPAVFIITLMVIAFYKEVKNGWVIRNDEGKVISVEGYKVKEEYLPVDDPETAAIEKMQERKTTEELFEPE